jgi:predicted  nucleic acid-binding Zn-ribbon protein
MIIDAHATDTTPSHEVRQRANEALANAGEPMSEVTYDALRKRIEKLSEDLLHSQTRETEYEEGFTEGLHVGTKNARDLVVAVRDLMKTIAGLVNNGSLELKSDKEAGQFLAHALNRVEEAIEVVDQQ